MSDSNTQSEMEFTEPMFSKVLEWFDPFLGLAALILIFIAAYRLKGNTNYPYGSYIFYGLLGSLIFSIAGTAVETVQLFDYQIERNLSSSLYLVATFSSIVAAHGFLGLANYLKSKG